MPRKTDGTLFELHPRPTTGDDGKPLLYARPASGQKLDIDALDEYCARHHGCNYGEMKRLFETFIDVASRYIADGYRIETPIGSFSQKVRLVGDHTDPEKVTGRDVFYAGIEYTPSKRFTREVERRHRGFRKAGGPVGNAQMYDERAMRSALERSLSLGYTTVHRFQTFSGLKRDSAKRYLDSLCTGDTPTLRCYREGRILHYLPADK